MPRAGERFCGADRQRYLEQLDSNIGRRRKITYPVKEQKMQAFSEKGKRVTTVLVRRRSCKDKTKP